MTIYKFKDLYNRIDEILWKYWDPIGVNANEDIGNEYKTYTPHIFRLKTDNSNKEEISKKLFEIETQIMGLAGNMDRCTQVAERIQRLR